MTKSGNKSVANDQDVGAFVESLDDPKQIEDTKVLLDMFGRVTGKKPVMWGSAMIGYGKVRMVYESGREVEWFEVGFSPRKGKITLYVTFDAEELTGKFPELGKYKTGKGCIYITRLSDVDLGELEQLVTVAHKSGYGDPKRADGKETSLTVEVLE